MSVDHRTRLASDLYERSGFRLPTDTPATDSTAALPAEGGLTESQAIDLALANNAAFQEQLASLGLAQADVIQAGLITNPDALLLIPVGPKQLEATITAPLEALWLRGPRMQAARLASDQAVARMAQLGLDLIRDVRLAFADLGLARRRLALFQDASKLRGQVAGIADARLRAGDAVPLDAAVARIDLVRAELEAKSLAYSVAIAEERMRALLGAGTTRTPIATTDAPDAATAGDWNVDALVDAAVADRADVKAADLAVTAARDRSRLARYDWLNLSFVADANERGSKGFEAGPGVRFALPIFNQNQGLIARADAELDRLVRAKQTLRDRVILEVREAYARFAQARDDAAAWRGQILPALDSASELARRAYRSGETTLVQVYDVERQLLDARLREAQAVADLRRARAELERSAGRRLDTPAAAPVPTAPKTESN